MGRIDDFIAQQVGDLLAPQEPIMGTAALWRPLASGLLFPSRGYEAFLGAVTPTRLILICTDRGRVDPLAAPKARTLGVTSFGFDELTRVELGAANSRGGRTLKLSFRPGTGPDHVDAQGDARYEVFPSAEGVGGHRAFYRHFGDWLRAKVAAGAFPPRPETVAKEARARREGRVPGPPNSVGRLALLALPMLCSIAVTIQSCNQPTNPPRRDRSADARWPGSSPTSLPAGTPSSLLPRDADVSQLLKEKRRHEEERFFEEERRAEEQRRGPPLRFVRYGSLVTTAVFFWRLLTLLFGPVPSK